MGVTHLHQIATTTACLCSAILEEHSVWWISESAQEAFTWLSLCLRRSNSRLVWLALKHTQAKIQNFLRKLKGLNIWIRKLFHS